MSNKDCLRTTLMAAISCAVFFALVVPVQTYVANRDFFTFSTSQIMCELLGWTVLAVLVLALGSYGCCWMLLKTRLQRVAIFPSVVLIVMMAWGYLEIGVLSFGLPSLDGDIDAMSSMFHKMLDLVVLGGTGLLLVVLLEIFPSCAKYFAGAVLLLGMASIFDAYTQKTEVKRDAYSSCRADKYDIAKSIRYSRGKNVFMFIVDSLPGSVATDVVMENPELKEKFAGFVTYSDNVAMHEFTARGLPGLMTGRYYDPKESAATYSSSIFGTESFIYPWLEKDASVYFIPGLFDFGYTNRLIERHAKTEERNGLLLFRKCGLMPSLSLWEVVRFRLTPYSGKYLYMLGAINRGKTTPNVEREDILFPIMHGASMSGSREPTLCVVHTRGVHTPIFFGRDGKYLERPRNNLSGVKDATYSIFFRIGEFLDHLKVLGIYDASTIVITTDHGNLLMPHSPDEMGQVHAALLIKAAEDTGPCVKCATPTSTSKVAGIMRQVLNRNLTRQEMEVELRTKERLFRARIARQLYMYDWKYGPGLNLLRRERLELTKE